MLVAGALGLVLMALGLMLFRRIGSASLAGSSQLQLQTSTRETLRRIPPILRMAMPPNSQQTAIYYPDIGASAANVVFCCPEDLVDNTSSATFNPRDPVYFLFQMRWEPATQQIVLEDFYSPDRSRIMARQVSAFRVARTQRIGLRLQLERQVTIRDSRGYPKVQRFELSETFQLVE